jgi:hypothetical protein
MGKRSLDAGYRSLDAGYRPFDTGPLPLSGPRALCFFQQSAHRHRATNSPLSFFSRDTRHPWADEMRV